MRPPGQVNKWETSMQNQEKRKFKRYDLGVRAVAQSGDAGDAGQQEAVWLCDLSGEGTLFHTACPDWYVPGEPVSLMICMPGAPGVHATMRTRGIVSRVEAGRSKGEALVALQFLVPLQFARDQAGIPAACQ
jgi:hypothetical protein